MRDLRLLIALGLSLLVACRDSSDASNVATRVTPILNAAPKTTSDIDALIKTTGPSLLKTFRSRMNFVAMKSQVTEQPGAFGVSAEIQYHSFFKQTPRTARLSFVLSAAGLVTQCTLEDPIKKAAAVSCSQLEAKLAQILAPAFQ
jgi:hypothetical protein